MSEDIRIRDLEAGGEASAAIAAALDRGVRVILPPGSETWSRQLLAICLVDLLARLLPAIEISCDPDVAALASLPPGAETLSARLQDARANSMVDPQELTGEPGLTVLVGREGEADLFFDGSGWVGYYGDRPGEDLGEDERNPIGPLIAACRGAGQVVRALLGDLLPGSGLGEPTYWSALTMSPCEPPQCREGPALADPRIDALLMGAGSIGGAATYALARVPGLGGSFPIVDLDALEAKNSRKALLARRPEIDRGAAKAEVAVAELAHLGELDSAAHGQSLGDYVAARPASEPLPLVLCAVDSIPARRQLADHMPLEVVNAACNDTEISVSGHRTDEGPCIYCLYIDRVLDTEATRTAMIVRDLSLPAGLVIEMRVKGAGLERQHLTHIERIRGLPPGALANFRGRSLDELYDEHVLYGEIGVRDEQGRRSALQLAFVPALAGVLLAAEALKHGSGDDFRPYRLGPDALATEYRESLLQPPVGMLLDPPRQPGSSCLCGSPRRLALMRERYGPSAA